MNRNSIATILCGLFLVYLAVYLVNSVAGGYRLIFVSSISHPINYAADFNSRTNVGAIAWQPRYGKYTRLTSDALGKFFFPLIIVDQTIWHRDIPVAEIESRESFKRRVSLQQVHPNDRSIYTARPLH